MKYFVLLSANFLFFGKDFLQISASVSPLQGSKLYSISPRAAPASGVLALGCVLTAPLGPFAASRLWAWWTVVA